MNKINIINPLKNNYINNLELKNLTMFLGGDLKNISEKAISTISGILKTNYIQIGKDMINNIKSNKQLKAKLKEFGYELYLVLGDGALFITEEKNEKLKAGIKATSNIGNFLFLPFKSLGIIVYSLIMTACSGFPPCALIHRVLKTGNRFLKVFTKTLELGLRIVTGNLEEFNNMLQLIIEAFVMIPGTVQKLIHIFNLGKDVGKALRGEKIEVNEEFMNDDSNGLLGKFSMNDMSLGSIGSPLDGKNKKDNKNKTKKSNKKNKKTKKKKKK